MAKSKIASSILRLRCFSLATRVVLCGALSMVAAVSQGQQSAPIIAVSDSVAAHKNFTRLSFDLNHTAPFNAYVLANPDRVIVDLPEVNFQIATSTLKNTNPREGTTSSERIGLKNNPNATSLIQNFRFGLMGKGRSRIVIDLAAPAKIALAEMQKISTGEPVRFTIELRPTPRADFLSAARKAASQITPDDTGQPSAMLASDNGKTVIVLDPGHGGIDSGATNSSGFEEKKLTLAFANLLREKLEANRRYLVVMTRTDDHYVSLSQRVKVGRSSKAKLFISLHADSLSGGEGVHGATVYTLSNKASDAAAARMAAEENSVDSDAGLVAQSAEPKGVNDILNELMLRETRTYSHLFATSIAKFWRPTGQMNNHPLRSASFVVLKDPEVPSVLVELGYISSHRDLSDLTSDIWREKTALILKNAVDSFFEAQNGVSYAASAAISSPTSALGAAAPKARR